MDVRVPVTVLVVILAMFGAGCWSATPTAPLAPSTTQPQVVFNFDTGVSEADQNAIRAGADLALAYFRRTFQWTPTRDITFNVAAAGGNSSGTASATTVTINTGTEVWKSRGTDAFHQETVAHELFHLLQLNIGWSGPVWLTEGSAVFIGWQVALSNQVSKVLQMRELARSPVSFSLLIPCLHLRSSKTAVSTRSTTCGPTPTPPAGWRRMN